MGDKNLAMKKNLLGLGSTEDRFPNLDPVICLKQQLKAFTVWACLALILQPTGNDPEALVYMPTYCC